MIVKNMGKRLRSKTHTKRILTTNRLLPLGSLRRVCVQKIFSGWILDLVGEGRILTHKLARQVCFGLRKKLDLPPNETDNDLEVQRMHKCLKAARKRQIGKPKPTDVGSSMSSVDNMQTLLLEDTATWPEDCPQRFF